MTHADFENQRYRTAAFLAAHRFYDWRICQIARIPEARLKQIKNYLMIRGDDWGSGANCFARAVIEEARTISPENFDQFLSGQYTDETARRRGRIRRRASCRNNAGGNTPLRPRRVSFDGRITHCEDGQRRRLQGTATVGMAGGERNVSFDLVADVTGVSEGEQIFTGTGTIE